MPAKVTIIINDLICSLVITLKYDIDMASKHAADNFKPI